MGVSVKIRKTKGPLTSHILDEVVTRTWVGVSTQLKELVELKYTTYHPVCLVYFCAYTTPRVFKLISKTKWGCGLVWRAMLKNMFANMSAHGGPFFKPIFALKPRDWGGPKKFSDKILRHKMFNIVFVNTHKNWSLAEFQNGLSSII